MTLNDLKLLQMINFGWFLRHNDGHKESYDIIWGHLSHKVTRLAILYTCNSVCAFLVGPRTLCFPACLPMTYDQ